MRMPMTRRRLPFSIAAGGLLCALAAASAFSDCGGGGGGGGGAGPAQQWAVVGSSSAAGVGATPGHGWAELLAADEAPRGVQLHNLAHTGLTTYGALPSATAVPPNRPAPDPQANVTAALALRPRLLLVSLPNNDTADGYAPEETVRNLLAIRAEAQAQGVAVLMLSTQPRALPAAQLALLPHIDQQVAAAAGPCFVPLRAGLAGPDGRLAPAYDSGDGVHLNDAGHRWVWQQVREVLHRGDCVAP
jgi:lysophospholipase L1-like esterase